MEEYDGLIVALLSAALMIFYIFIEARPKGSHFVESVKNTITRFFRSR
jgi:hypothetical protein|tara:strand:+ start:12334 stop:12477 length:144 start_codon:yes stop_codon:yes gene_type:complete